MRWTRWTASCNLLAYPHDCLRCLPIVLAGLAAIQHKFPMIHSSRMSTWPQLETAAEQRIRSQIFGHIWDLATDGVCLASLIPFAAPVLGPVCGVMKACDTAFVVTDIAGIVCDATPVTLSAVAASPASISEPVNGPSVTETPHGTFSSSSKFTARSTLTISELVLDHLGLPDDIAKAAIGNKVIGAAVRSVVQIVGDNVFSSLIDLSSPSDFVFSKDVALTTATTSLESDPNSIVQVNGLTVTPTAAFGTTSLFFFNTSSFRMFDSDGNVTDNPVDVPNNSLPVVITPIVAVKVFPPPLRFPPMGCSSSQQPSRENRTRPLRGV